MNRSLEDLILEYEKHLEAGENIVKTMKIQGKQDTCAYRSQRIINCIWKMILKDLGYLADKSLYENN